jgi:hypothetical protein
MAYTLFRPSLPTSRTHPANATDVSLENYRMIEMTITLTYNQLMAARSTSTSTSTTKGFEYGHTSTHYKTIHETICSTSAPFSQFQFVQCACLSFNNAPALNIHNELTIHSLIPTAPSCKTSWMIKLHAYSVTHKPWCFFNDLRSTRSSTDAPPS